MKLSLYLKDPNSLVDTVIFCRIVYNNQMVKIYTDKSINPKFWNKKEQKAKEQKTFPQYPEFNQHLKDTLSKIDSIFTKCQKDNNGQPPATDILKTEVNKYFQRISEEEKKKMVTHTFWGFFNDFIERCENGSRLHLRNNTPMATNTIKNFENLRHHLKEFEKSKKLTITFEGIDLNFHKFFTAYLTVNQKLSTNTIGKLITNLKVLLREALEMGKHNNMVFSFRKFKSISVSTETIYLNDAEIKELVALDLSTNSKYDRVRDIFIVGCYTGLRFSDLSQLTEKNIKDGLIDLTTIKTNTNVLIPVQNEVAKVLAKYNGTMPKVISNQKFNDYIKDVCSKCELLTKEVEIKYTKGGKIHKDIKQKFELVASHTARRSFATNEFDKGDLQVFEIKAITGHKTDKSFYAYIRKDAKETALQTAKKWNERELKAAARVPHLKAV